MECPSWWVQELWKVHRCWFLRNMVSALQNVRTRALIHSLSDDVKNHYWHLSLFIPVSFVILALRLLIFLLLSFVIIRFSAAPSFGRMSIGTVLTLEWMKKLKNHTYLSNNLSSLFCVCLPTSTDSEHRTWISMCWYDGGNNCCCSSTSYCPSPHLYHWTVLSMGCRDTRSYHFTNIYIFNLTNITSNAFFAVSFEQNTASRT